MGILFYSLWPCLDTFMITRLHPPWQWVWNWPPRQHLAQQKILRSRQRRASTPVRRWTSTLAATTSPSSWTFSTGRNALPPAFTCQIACFGPWTTETPSTGVSQKPAMLGIAPWKVTSVVQGGVFND